MSENRSAEDEELERALKLSAEEHAAAKQREEEKEKEDSSYSQMMEAAIAASMEDAALHNEMLRARETESKIIKQEDLILPAELVVSFKKLRYIYEFELGVKLTTFLDDFGKYILRITHTDEDIVSIAKIQLESIIASPELLTTRLDNLRKERVHVFVDNSNIYLGAQIVFNPLGRGRESITRNANMRLKCPALAGLVEGCRNCLEKVVFGSQLTGDSTMWKHWKQVGYQIQTSEIGAEGLAVDEAVLTQMRASVVKNPCKPPHVKHTLVLLTGDATEDQNGNSFFSVVKEALELGWKVELWTWRAAMSRRYVSLLEVYGGNVGDFIVMYLDEYRDSITYEHTADGTAAKAAVSDTNTHSSLRRVSVYDLNDEEEENFLCRLTNKVIEDPVVTKFGHHFERDALYVWIRNHRTCPVLGMPLTWEEVKPADKEYLEKLAKFKESH
eukprot:gene6176-6811_t